MKDGTNIRVRVGDLFASDAQTLVNTVNTVGVMGKGIAAGFRERYPDMYRDYARRCTRHEVKLGEPYLWAPLFGQWVLNFPTKEHWRSAARRDAIVAGLQHLEVHYRDWGITSLAVPPLGCGEGRLEWSIVGPTLYEYLRRLEIPVELYAPHGSRPEELDRAFLSREGSRLQEERTTPLHVSPGAIALAAIVGRITSEPHHWPVGRTIFQKLAYFATQTGIETNLTFEERGYGPFAPDLKRLQSRLENNAVLEEYPVGSRMLALRPGPEFHAAESAYEPYLTRWSDAIARVADLFLRLSTRQAEVAATAHFVAMKLQRDTNRAPTEWEVWKYIEHWKHDRLQSEDVAFAIRKLAELGWLPVTRSEGLPVPEDLAIVG